MKTMTVRNVSEATAAALDVERRRRGLSLNRTVLALLSRSRWVSADGWSEEGFQRFEESVAPFARVEEDLWK